jgi:hypothetical protein
MLRVPCTSGIPRCPAVERRRERADHSVSAANGGIDRAAVAQLGRDDGQLRIADGELPGRPHDRDHLVIASERLLDHLAADAPGGAEHDDALRANGFARLRFRGHKETIYLVIRSCRLYWNSCPNH